MQTLKGIPVSPGVVIGRVFVLDDAKHRIARRVVPAEAIPTERARLTDAIANAIGELSALKDRTQHEMGDEAAGIFAFHLGWLQDRSVTDPMHRHIDREGVTAEYAAWSAFHDQAARFRAMPDPTLQTKVDDIYDLSQRVIRHLIGEHSVRLKRLDHNAVVIARDLTPSQTAAFDRAMIRAFATDHGGRTSHTAIFARALGIPAVVGVGSLSEMVTDGTTIIIDGYRGTVIIDPDTNALDRYKRLIEDRKRYRDSLVSLSELPSVTTDGVHIELLGNIEFADEVPDMLAQGTEGVGLYRTEYLYLTGNSEPTEEDHFEAYKRTIDLLDGKPLIIRTVDLGADKYTQEQFEEPERNPFLGLRSIRYCLQRLAMFQTQLRAILRASAHGPVKIMFPLVTNPTEFRQGKYLLHDVMEDLDEEGIAFDRTIELGMMVEVPSAALMAETFAKEVAFFSIGTNDLVQYTLAVDRTNERVASMYNPAHPAIIRLIKDVVRAARRNDVPVSCCGESAGELEFAMLLIGLGLRTLSVTASSAPPLKRLIREVSIPQCERLAKKAASLDSDVAVTAYLRDRVRRILPDALEGGGSDL